MSSISFAQFVYGEIGQESGGNYQARSPGGALGKYQILASNIPSWSKQIIGYSISPDEFLASPALQDEIAVGMLYHYFKQYGPEGAASAWYTGNPNAWQSGGGGDNYGGPSAAGYVQQVMSRAQSYTGDGSDLVFNKYLPHGSETANISGHYTVSSYSGGGAVSDSAPAPAKLTAADYEAALGSLSGLLTGVPELRGILQKAVSGGWATSKFQQQVEQSKWYRTHNSTARELVSLQYSDPAEYKTRVANAMNQVNNLARQMGIILNPRQVQHLAGQFMVQGWDQQELNQQVAGQFNAWDTKHPLRGGAIGAAYQQLQELYGAYGIPVSELSLRYRAQQIAAGVQTVEAYKQSAVSTAQSMYPSLSAQLRAGQTVKDIADPYIQTMSRVLEVDPNSVGVTDPLIRKALQGASVTTGGKTSFLSTPIWQFEQQLRNDPRWAKTQNARDTVSTALTAVGRDFGYTQT